MKTLNIASNGLFLSSAETRESEFGESVLLTYTDSVTDQSGSIFGAPAELPKYQALIAARTKLLEQLANGDLSIDKFLVAEKAFLKPGEVKKLEVEDYVITDEDGNEKTLSSRYIVRLGNESWDEAALKAGHILADSSASEDDVDPSADVTPDVEAKTSVSADPEF